MKCNYERTPLIGYMFWYLEKTLCLQCCSVHMYLLIAAVGIAQSSVGVSCSTAGRYREARILWVARRCHVGNLSHITLRGSPLTLLLRPGRGAEYCEQFFCLSVCPRDYLWNHWNDLHNFFCRSPMPVARSSSGGIAICYVLPVLWMTSRLAVVGRMAMHGRLNLKSPTTSGVARPGQSLMSMNALFTDVTLLVALSDCRIVTWQVQCCMWLEVLRLLYMLFQAVCLLLVIHCQSLHRISTRRLFRRLLRRHCHHQGALWVQLSS